MRPRGGAWFCDSLWRQPLCRTARYCVFHAPSHLQTCQGAFNDVCVCACVHALNVSQNNIKEKQATECCIIDWRHRIQLFVLCINSNNRTIVFHASASLADHQMWFWNWHTGSKWDDVILTFPEVVCGPPATRCTRRHLRHYMEEKRSNWRISKSLHGYQNKLCFLYQFSMERTKWRESEPNRPASIAVPQALKTSSWAIHEVRQRTDPRSRAYRKSVSGVGTPRSKADGRWFRAAAAVTTWRDVTRYTEYTRKDLSSFGVYLTGIIWADTAAMQSEPIPTRRL